MAAHFVPGHAAHGGVRPLDGASERVSRKSSGQEQITHEVRGRVVHHLDLFEDHAPLPLQLLRRESGPGQHVREHLEGFGKMGLLDAEVETHDLPRGEGVQHAAHLVEDAVDLAVSPGGRALEDQVFNEVAYPVDPCRLLARAALHPNSRRHRRKVGQALHHHGKAVGEDSALDLSAVRHGRSSEVDDSTRRGIGGGARS